MPQPTMPIRTESRSRTPPQVTAPGGIRRARRAYEPQRSPKNFAVESDIQAAHLWSPAGSSHDSTDRPDAHDRAKTQGGAGEPEVDVASQPFSFAQNAARAALTATKPAL